MLDRLTEEDFSNQSFEELDGKALQMEEKHFEEVQFSKCNFSGAIFKKCKFLDCTFEHCDLSNIELRGTSIRGSKFQDCKLIGVNWTNANSISHVYFENCVLNYTNFNGLDLRKSVIRKCIARESDFAETNLSECDCRWTDFAAARFANTNLTKSDFRHALNYSIRPDANTLKGAKFSLPEATLLLYGLDIVLEH